MSLFFKTSKTLQKGFSLVELLVSIGIITVILSVVVLNQRSYTESTLLSNLAEEITLSIAEAQAYGLAVRERAPGSSDFNSGYGLSFTLLEQGAEDGYIFFADRNTNNHYYDGNFSCSGGAFSECLEKKLFGGGNSIESFCVLRTQGADQCGTVSRADISFIRPNVEAQIIFFNAGGNVYSTPNLKGVRITLSSPKGLQKSVVVYTTGQVSVEE